MEMKEPEELYLINYENGKEYYEITCDGWLYDSIYHDGPLSPEQQNLVDTSFDYAIDGYGWGAGGCSPVSSKDISFLYDRLCRLKAGLINEFHCYFKNKNFYSGYYLKVKISRKKNHTYKAHYRIYDDLDCVVFNQQLTETDLEDQIRNLKACTEKFPVRSL